MNTTTADITPTTAAGSGTTTTKVVQLNISLPTALEVGGVCAVNRHELLARQPSYCKILNDLQEAEPESEARPPSSAPSYQSLPLPQRHQQGLLQAHLKEEQELQEASQIKITKSPPTSIIMKNEAIEMGEVGDVIQAPTVVINGQSYQIVNPTLSEGGTSVTSDTIENVLSIANSGPSAGSQFSNASVFLASLGNSAPVPHQAEEQVRKREVRLFKNKEAARECRNKKKEYIKCLENRVAVLENQNKALIEELKLLKEIYKSNN